MTKTKILLLLLHISLFICFRQVSAETDPIKLAATMPLSGAYASYGKLIQEGIELARHDLKKLGYPTEIIYEDACMPAAAVTAIKKLATVDQIDALAANFCVIALPPMAAVIEKNKIIAFHTAAASDSVLNAGEYIFTTNIKVQNEARKIAEYAIKKLSAQTASVLYVGSDFGEDYNRYFSQRFKQLGGKILSSDGAAVGVNSFRSELMRALSKKPQVIFAAHLGETLSILLKEARQLGFKGKILGVYEAEDPSVLQIAGKYAEELLFFVPEPLNESAKLKEFRRKFNQKFGHHPRILASNAYDATRIVVEMLAKCNKNSECAKKEIYKIKDYPGVSGTFSIDSDGGTIKGFVLKTVRDGKFVRVE